MRAARAFLASALAASALRLAGAAPPSPAPSDPALADIDRQIAAAKIDRKNPDWKFDVPKPRAAPFDPAKRYLAKVETNLGTVIFRLRPDWAPMHVTSFAYLARLGYFDGTPLYKVYRAARAEGGCPLGTGTGGPGYYLPLETTPDVKFDRRGLLASITYDLDGSRFAVFFAPAEYLNGKLTIYGELEAGKDALDAIEAVGTPSGSSNVPVTVKAVTVEAR